MFSIRPALFAFVLALPAGPVLGQSLTSAGLRGTVRDGSLRELFDASITITSLSTGVTRQTISDRNGRFHFSLLPPGRYDLVVERLGYRPRRVMQVPVLPGEDAAVTVDLVPAPPPVERSDTVRYAAGATAGRGPDLSERMFRSDLRGLPDDARDLHVFLRHATTATDLGLTALPGSMTQLVIDGVPFAPARHPVLEPGLAGATALPFAASDRVTLMTNPVDVEWAGSAGGFMAVDTRRGSNQLRFESFGDWAGAQTADSKYFDIRSAPHTTWRGGGILTGPVKRDTASFAAGIEVGHLQTAWPPLADRDSVIARVFQVARDSFQQDIQSYAQPRVTDQQQISGFTRLDWQLTPAHLLRVSGNFAGLKGSPPDLYPMRPASPGSRIKSADVGGAVALTSVISSRLAQELRIGFTRSQHEFTGAPLPGTLLARSGVFFGTDPAMPARLGRTEGRLQDVLHLDAGTHRLKFGTEGVVTAVDNNYVEGRPGTFTFGDSPELAQRRGVFTRTVGAFPGVRFSLPRFALFLQDSWTPGGGLRLTAGLRFDYLRVPRSKVAANDSLLAITGLDNTSMRASRIQLSPRAGFSWRPTADRRLMLSGSAGLYSATLDESLFGEVVALATGVHGRSAVGTLPDWPDLPDSASAPYTGQEAALSDPPARTPRSAVFTFGLSGALSGSTALHLIGSYRHTDFLPRRHDLNAPALTTSDNRGRPIYGSLVQLGNILAATPGSNQRFGEFHHIWAFDADGFSDYWGATVALERQSVTGLQLLASYTYSKSTDNWLSRPGLGIAQQVTPFPAGLSDRDWAKGPSDLDIPHHVSVAIVLPALSRRVGPRLGFLYQFRSGYPFTPGFRDGVDANGDGSAQNDPAYVDETIAGTSQLFGGWRCLERQTGGFAGRNSCRAPGFHHLDVRLSIGALRAIRIDGDIVLDALNILDSGDAIPDRALYLVNPAGAIAVNGTTGVLTLPLVVNPDFGRTIARRSSARSLRLGVRFAL